MKRCKKALSLTLGGLCLLTMAFLLSGCASDEQEIDPGSNSRQRNTSSVPWNRPQSWEGNTGYGGMMNQPGR